MIPTPKEFVDFANERRSDVPYFGLGFRKATLDREIYQNILQHFARQKDSFFIEHEITYLRNDKPRYSPALMVHDQKFNRALGKELKPLHEAWSKMPLRETSCYGIRVYQPGSFLFNHVDQSATHIISSTICVGHQLNTPWPLYIEDIDGHPHEVSLSQEKCCFMKGPNSSTGDPIP